MRLLQHKKSNIFVLTKIHSLVEAKVKIKLLRENKIVVPVFVVPPHVKKSEICLPTETSLLIDDSQKNIDDWEDKGGIGFLFDGSENDVNRQKILECLYKNHDYGKSSEVARVKKIEKIKKEIKV